MRLKTKNEKKSIIIVFLFLLSSLSFSLSIKSARAQRNHEIVNVLLLTKYNESSLISSLMIDKESISLTIAKSTNYKDYFDDLDDFDVFIIDRFLPKNLAELQTLKSHIDGTIDSKGLIVFGFLENDFTSEQVEAISDLLPVEINPDYNSAISPNDTSNPDYKIQISLNSNVANLSNNVVIKHIPWTSCPLIAKRLVVENKKENYGVIESIDGIYAIFSEWTVRNVGGKVLFYSMEIDDNNKPFTLWPYFNYLVYTSIFHVKSGFSELNIESYSAWPYSPIPHTIEIIFWFIMVACLWIITFWLYFKYRNKELLQNQKTNKSRESITNERN